ncbi:RTA1 domain-containing protein [Aspergillus stella-maris]|uniref:RTA1 domain-containing protein n=1 Tax=Aspergillus stella-maris TaxID=1810926 RepID=UPI003CCCD66F
MRSSLFLLLLNFAVTVLAAPASTATTGALDAVQLQQRATAPLSSPGIQRAIEDTVESTPTLVRRDDETCTPTISPDANGYVPPTECNAMYSYYPSFGAAIAFSTLFGILVITHFAQAISHKASFAWVILMSAIWEFGGFVTRTLSTRHQQSESLATVSQILILLAPLWVNAFDYMVLARMIHFFMPERRIGIIKPAHLTNLFVLLDIASFIVQAVGGLMASPTSSAETMQTGIHIYMIGMGVQEFFILIFLGIAITFHRRIFHLEKAGALPVHKTQWRGMLYALYVSLVFITIRIIYRLVEYSSGTELSNPIVSHEWFMYVFDAVPMCVAIGVWCLVHPGGVLRGQDARMPTSPLGRFFRCCCCCGCCRRGRKSKNVQKREESQRPRSNEMLMGSLPERGSSPYT